MPDVIVKSRYVTSKKHISNLINYISTREGVEILPDNAKELKATAKQLEFIKHNKKKMESLAEYKTFLSKPTMYNASQAIAAYAKSVFENEGQLKQFAYKRADNISPEERDKPATEKQKEFIEKHSKGLEDLPEFTDYRKSSTVGNASELISAISEYLITDSTVYLNYIAERPGVFKSQGEKHGLFNMNGKADKKSEVEKLSKSESVVWVHIISLRREDAKRLGFENADSWRKVIASNAPRIAKLYNIDIKNLNVLGAFHNEGHHPHVHLIVYSDRKAEGIIPKKQMTEAGKKMRSMFTNSIFSLDMKPIISKRNELRENISRRVAMTSHLFAKDYEQDSKVTASLLNLSKQLPYTGKLTYAYLQPEVKNSVNSCLRRIVESDSTLSNLVSEYFSLQHSLIEKYNDNPEKAEAKYIDFVEHFYEPRCGKFSDGSDITALHNIIIKYASEISESVPNFPQQEGVTVENMGSAGTSPQQHNSNSSTHINSFAVKYAALSVVRIIGEELSGLCNTVESCSRPSKSNCKRSRKHPKHRSQRKNINYQEEYK